jgi:hypothetical protein
LAHRQGPASEATRPPWHRFSLRSGQTLPLAMVTWSVGDRNCFRRGLPGDGTCASHGV